MPKIISFNFCLLFFFSLSFGLMAGMPSMPYLYAGDFIEVLRKKHAENSYKKMVENFLKTLILVMSQVFLLFLANRALVLPLIYDNIF